MRRRPLRSHGSSTFINIEDLITASNALLQSILDAVRGGSPESNGGIGNYGKDYDPLTAAGPKVASMQIDMQQSSDGRFDRLNDNVERMLQLIAEGNGINAGGFGEVASGLQTIRRDRGLVENGRPRNTPRAVPLGKR